MISLLDGLNEQIGRSIFSGVTEADEDSAMDQEFALEAATDKNINLPTLSEEDIRQIMNDDNPDNQVADIGPGDEDPQKIGDDSIDDELKAIEAMLDAMAEE